MGETDTEGRPWKARQVQDAFDTVGIDLEPKRVRNSANKKGPNPFYLLLEDLSLMVLFRKLLSPNVRICGSSRYV